MKQIKQIKIIQILEIIIIKIAVIAVFLVACTNQNRPVFTHDEVMQHIPKGPSKCFRQICFDINEKQYYPDSVFNTFFSEHDPVKYAEFCEKINLDAALLLNVTQSGYATYRQTIVNDIYPGMKGDFFGETLKELHKRGISGFGYVGIGWIMKFAQENPELTDGNMDRPLICLNSKYRDKVIGSTREILNNYPVDGIRFDILDHPTRCRCNGCKKLYLEMFEVPMPGKWVDWQHKQEFRLESIRRIVKDLYDVCKSIKPSVPVWQNWFDGQLFADISDVGNVDMSYLEFADPYRELLLNGVFDKNAIITGKVIENPDTRWKCLALGGRCYSYFASVGKTGLPDLDPTLDRDVASDWFEKNLAPFYGQVKEAQSFLVDTKPVTNIAAIFNEKTRYHYDNFLRAGYVHRMRRIIEPFLYSGNPVRFISASNISKTALDKYEAVIIPESCGFTDAEREIMRTYVKNGGKLVVTGDVFSYTGEGEPLADFTMSDIMGVSRKYKPIKYKPEEELWDTSKSNVEFDKACEILNSRALPAKNYSNNIPFVPVTVKSGKTISYIKAPNGKEHPLVHENKYGKGIVYYVASLEMSELTSATVNYAKVTTPVSDKNMSAMSVLTKKTDEDKWILHLLDKGEFSIKIDKQYCPASKIASTFATESISNVKFSEDGNYIKIEADNNNEYAAIILN